MTGLEFRQFYFRERKAYRKQDIRQQDKILKINEVDSDGFYRMTTRELISIITKKNDLTNFHMLLTSGQ